MAAVTGCPPTGHGGNALEMPSGFGDNRILKAGLAGLFDVDYYFQVELYLRNIGDLEVNTDFSLFYAGGFTVFDPVGLFQNTFQPAYVYVTDLVNPPTLEWTLEFGTTSAHLRDVVYPTDCAYHVIDGRMRVASGPGPSYDLTTEWRLDGVSFGTITEPGDVVGPPSGFWLGTALGGGFASIPYYYANVKMGTGTWGASDIWSDDFTSGLGAYSVAGAPTIVAAP